MAELKAAYAEIDRPREFEDMEAVSMAVGYYEGLKRAAVALTGRTEADVAAEVVAWYIGTPEYQAAKEHYDSRQED
jgi:hypothetical protein